MKLYVYDHCPFSAKVRFLAGLKKIPLELVIMPYAEEKALIELIGKKAVPILCRDDGTIMAESLDIIFWLDNNFGTASLVNESTEAVNEWLKDTMLPLQKVGYPRWPKIALKEFASEEDRVEWEKRKAPAVGSFAQALAETPETTIAVEKLLERAESLLENVLQADRFVTLAEINLFSFLRGFTSLEELKWPVKLKKWFDLRIQQSGMNLLQS
ncbi:MAG: glutaredoxin 2 [Ostreibacterium sp.]